MNIRKLTLSDIDILIRLRMDYIAEDMGSPSESEKDAIISQLRAYFRKHIPEDTFFAFVAEQNGDVLASAFLAISEKPANPAFTTGRVGTLMNVLTYPAYRNTGIATQLIECVISEAKRLNVSLIELSSTGMGSHLYEKLGFEPSGYKTMRMKL